MNGPYREAARAPTKRRVEAEESIAASERKAGPLVPLFLPRALRERITQLREAGDDDDTRVELAAALEESLAIAREREAFLRDLPREPPSEPRLDDLWGPIGTEKAAAPVVSRVERAARSLDRQATVRRTGPRVTAWLTASEAPIVWSLYLSGALFIGGNGAVTSFLGASHWIATSVPDDTPRIFARQRRIEDGVLTVLRLRREVKLGDARFDRTFHLEGDPVFAQALFAPDLRDAFLERAQRGDFTFLLAGSTASVVYQAGVLSALVAESALEPSLAVLVSLRQALSDLTLLRRT